MSEQAGVTRYISHETQVSDAGSFLPSLLCTYHVLTMYLACTHLAHHRPWVVDEDRVGVARPDVEAEGEELVVEAHL